MVHVNQGHLSHVPKEKNTKKGMKKGQKIHREMASKPKEKDHFFTPTLLLNFVIFWHGGVVKVRLSQVAIQTLQNWCFSGPRFHLTMRMASPLLHTASVQSLAKHF